MKALTITTLAITGMSLLAGYGLIGQKEGFDKEKISDRVYRLEHNKHQIRCDQFAYGGEVSGAVFSCLRGIPPVTRLVGCASLGTAAGVLMHVATSEEEEGKKVDSLKQSVDNMAKELK